MANRPIKSLSQRSMYGTFHDTSENFSKSAEWNTNNSCKASGCRFFCYDLLICGMLISNFLIGNGFLAMPFALYQAGLLYGVLTLLAVTFLSYVSSMWTLEVMSRAQAVEYNRPSNTQYYSRDVLNSRNSKQSTVEHSRTSPSYLKPVPTYEVQPNRKFEIVELCGMFLGRSGQMFYLFCLTSFLIFTCWAYSTVVGTTLSSSIPWQPADTWRLCTANDFREVYIPGDYACRRTYWFYVAVFASAVIPLSCLDLNRQHYFQAFTTIVRVITVALMAGQCIYDIVNGRYEMILPGISANSTKGHNHSAHALLSNHTQRNHTIGPAEIDVDPLKFSFVGWLWCIPVILEAQVMQQSIPTVVYTLRNPSKLGKVMMFTFIFSTIVDVVYGVSVAWRFGHEVAENSALNWVKQRNAMKSSRVVVAYLVTFLPTLDVLSLFPMLCVTLANNLFVVVFGTDTSVSTNAMVKKVVFRLSIAIISVTGSIIVSNLFYVSKYAGFVGAIIGILFPAVLQYKSKEKCKRIFATLDFDSRTETANHPDEFHWVPISNSRSGLSNILSLNPRTDSLFVKSKISTPYSTIFSSTLCVILSSLFALGLIFCSATVYVFIN